MLINTFLPEKRSKTGKNKNVNNPAVFTFALAGVGM